MVILKFLYQVFYYVGVIGIRLLMVIFSVEFCFICIIIERLTEVIFVLKLCNIDNILERNIYVCCFNFKILCERLQMWYYVDVIMCLNMYLYCMCFILLFFFKLVVIIGIWNCLFNYIYVYLCKLLYSVICIDIYVYFIFYICYV